MMNWKGKNNLEEKEKKASTSVKKVKPKKNVELEKLKTEHKELNEKFLRTLAEMQNIKRRSEEEISRIRRYESEDMIVKLLDIVDDFERAITVNTDNAEIKKYLDGFEMIYAALIGILSSKNVEEIKCLHEEFNPSSAQAVLTEASDEYETGIVIDVLQKGYTYNDKVIRPAMVKVSE